jgi:hypothetical protein
MSLVILTGQRPQPADTFVPHPSQAGLSASYRERDPPTHFNERIRLRSLVQKKEFADSRALAEMSEAWARSSSALVCLPLAMR